MTVLTFLTSPHRLRFPQQPQIFRKRREALWLLILNNPVNPVSAFARGPDGIPEIQTKNNRSRAGSFSAQRERGAANDPQSDALFAFRWRQKVAPNPLSRRRRRLRRELGCCPAIGLRHGMHSHLFARPR